MKTLLPILILVSLFFSCHQQTENFSEEEGHKEIPSDWFYSQRAYPNGQIDKQAYFEAIRLKKSKIENSAGARAAEWELAGPINIGGRVTDIEMTDASFDIMYIGAASGGIFKTEDGGATFTPIFDDALSLSIGDIELAPSNQDIIYVGTGEANAGGGSLAYDGAGVYKSEDAGASWTHLGLTDAGSIGKVEVDPTDPNTVYVATMGNLFANNGQRGVFRSTDGGDNWENVLAISDSTGVIDLAIHPDNPNTIYAAAWERVRRPQFRKYAGPTSGIYRSTDGGTTWSELTAGLPSAPELKGRIGIAIAPSNSDVLYAVYAAENGLISGAFRSDDGGDNWNAINTDGVDNVPFMWWFGKVIVHPDNADRLYYLSLNTFESQNAGDNWNQIFNGQHVDQHDIFVHVADPSFVVSANDGGVHISQDGGQTYTKINTLPITQFYACEIDESFPEQLYGGTQDNGTNRTLTGDTDDWSSIFGGDGMNPLVNPLDNSIVYAGFQNGAFFKSTNGGANFSNSVTGIAGSDRKNWNTPKVFDPSDPNIMYYGANRLYKSVNGANTWTAISPDLTNGSGGGNLTYGTITTIAVSPLDGDIIWVGTDDGNISVTTDGGNNWQNVSDIPNRWVTRVASNPEQQGTAYATLSGYRYGEAAGHVYRTTDFGVNWEDISGDLPDIPVNDIIVNPDNQVLYIATDIGVFYSFNEGLNWEVLGEGFPNVPVTDLDFHRPTMTLVAATYGRSMYKIGVEEFTSTSSLVDNELNVQLAPNPFNQSTSLQINIEQGGQYEIELFDLLGKRIKSIHSGSLTQGIHNFEISGEGLPQGASICSITNEKGQKQQLRLLHFGK